MRERTYAGLDAMFEHRLPTREFKDYVVEGRSIVDEDKLDRE